VKYSVDNSGKWWDLQVVIHMTVADRDVIKEYMEGSGLKFDRAYITDNRARRLRDAKITANEIIGEMIENAQAET